MATEFKNLHFDRKQIADLRAALGHYGAKEFKSPTRSTVPLIALLKDRWDIVELILAKTQMASVDGLHLEYTVNQAKGKGTPSHTDLMVTSGDCRLAVEAKWTEPQYELVGDWLEQGNKSNRRKVMEGWLELLQKHAGKKLEVDIFSDVVYQMIHRAASACFEAKTPKLAYLHFVTEPDKEIAKNHYAYDLQNLHELLGHPDSFTFHCIKVGISPTKSFSQLRESIAKAPVKSDEVKNALLGSELFDFGAPEIQLIAK